MRTLLAERTSFEDSLTVACDATIIHAYFQRLGSGAEVVPNCVYLAPDALHLYADEPAPTIADEVQELFQPIARRDPQTVRAVERSSGAATPRAYEGTPASRDFRYDYGF
jgi:hypothetical protein